MISSNTTWCVRQQLTSALSHAICFTRIIPVVIPKAVEIIQVFIFQTKCKTVNKQKRDFPVTKLRTGKLRLEINNAIIVPIASANY